MNRARSHLVLIVIASFWTLRGAWANSDVQFPTDGAAWTVTTAVSPNDQTPRPLGGTTVAKVEVTQSREICRNVVTEYSGASRTTWTIPGSSLLLTEDPKGTAFLTPTSGIFYVPYLPSVFDWVGPSALQEKTPIDYQGKLCFHYKADGKEAWVDSKTRRPVALDNGTVLATFTFLSPPTEPLVLPPKFKIILQRYTMFMGAPRRQSPQNE
jgi:hypothetical protein